ncbi:hypothetical protein QSI_1215 [Clostridioides difficile P28]|nr:hypothetical protein QSI_1215 [Clostridioides difficile P28]
MRLLYHRVKTAGKEKANKIPVETGQTPHTIKGAEKAL